MRALIVGASGLVGGALLTEFSRYHEALGTCRSYSVPGLLPMGLEDAQGLKRMFGEFRAGVVLQAAALTAVDYCETHPEEAWRINVEGTRNVAEAAAGVGAKHVFFSTEYIFDGVAGPYSEQDRLCPLSVYGQSKASAEQAIREITDDLLIVRTTVVYGWERQGKNFVVRLLRQLRDGEQIAVPSDQISSPTYAPNLAQAVRELVEKDKRGIYNVAGPDIIDRYSFALMAAKAFCLPAGGIRPLSTAELNQAAPRPLNAGLRVKKALRELTTPLMGVNAGLAAMRASVPEGAGNSLSRAPQGNEPGS